LHTFNWHAAASSPHSHSHPELIRLMRQSDSQALSSKQYSNGNDIRHSFEFYNDNAT